MTTLEVVSYSQTLWKEAIPHITVPTIQDAAHWSVYPLSIIEKAILRTGRRFAADRVPPDLKAQDAYRYTSGVARSLTIGPAPHAEH